MPLKKLREPPLAAYRWTQRGDEMLFVIGEDDEDESMAKARAWIRVVGAVALGAALAFLAWQTRM